MKNILISMLDGLIAFGGVYFITKDFNTAVAVGYLVQHITIVARLAKDKKL